MQYNLELDKAVNEIKAANAKKVLIQLPDGLKPKAKEIINHLKQNTEAEFSIFLGTCFGACDTIETKDFDLVIQFGHTEFRS